jgi:pentapeptide MXKDX repeat protein
MRGILMFGGNTMRISRPRLLIFPFLLMFTLVFVIACGAAATPTSAPEDAMTTDAMPGDVMNQSGETMTNDSMGKSGDAMSQDSMGQAGDAMSGDAMAKENDAMSQDNMEKNADAMTKDGDAMADASDPAEKELVSGWYQGQEVRYYDFGSNTPVEDNGVSTAPIYVFIYGMNADGSPDFVEGQHNVVDVVPGDSGYSDLWQVMLVTVPEGYQPDSITSRDQLDAAGFEITATDMLVNCPIVPEGTTLAGGEELVQGWYKGQQVFYPDFGLNNTSAIPIWVFITGMDEQGNPQFVEGQRNIIDAVPGDPGYSAFWRVIMVTVPEGYEPDSIRSAADVMASGFTTTPANIVVNCPVTFVAES